MVSLLITLLVATHEPPSSIVKLGMSIGDSLGHRRIEQIHRSDLLGDCPGLRGSTNLVLSTALWRYPIHTHVHTHTHTRARARLEVASGLAEKWAVGNMGL